jgi:hypothetical protein
MLASLLVRGEDYWPYALAVVLALAVALPAFYAPQLRTVNRLWRWLLPGLRAAAVGALALSLLRPTLVQTRPQREGSSVLVLLDQSLSMGVADRTLARSSPDRRRITGQLVALADVLGKLDGDGSSHSPRGETPWATPERLRHLQLRAEDVVRAGRELDYARLSGRDADEARQRLDAAVGNFFTDARAAHASIQGEARRSPIARQLEQLARRPRPERREHWIRGGIADQVRAVLQAAEVSQDAADEKLFLEDPEVRRAAGALSRLSRFALCWEAIVAERGGLLAGLETQATVGGYALGESLIPIAFRADGAQAPLLSTPVLEPTAATSELGPGLREALLRVGLDNVQAAVLFSDGRRVGGDLPPLRREAASGVPVFTVYAAAPAVRDLSVERLELPRSVFVGERFGARLHARASGIDPRSLGGDATLTIAPSAQGAGELTLARPLVVRDKRVETVEFRDRDLRFDSPGVHKVTVDLPVYEGELSTVNNRIDRWIKVLQQKLRVTLLAGSPGWDFRFVRDALERSPWVELHSAVVIPGASALSMTAEQLLRQDLIILSDVPPDALSLEQWDAVLRLVRRRGGSVLIVPGPSFPHHRITGHALSELLPYRQQGPQPAWRVWPGQAPSYHMVPAASADALHALRLDESEQSSRERWDELPAFYRYLALPDLSSGARVLAIERDAQAPLLTETRVGAGRALFLATDETWRWRYKVGGQHQERFWMQLVRHAVGEPYALTSGPLSLDADDVMVRPGEPIRVRARLAPHEPAAEDQWVAAEPIPQRLELSVQQFGQTIRTEMLEAVAEARDGRYAATLEGLPEGEYHLNVSYIDPVGTDVSVSLPLKVERDTLPELADLSGDETYLRRLAADSGGKFLYLEQINQLPRLIEEVRARRPRLVERRLWDSGWLFIFVLSCLTAEWALRKRVGLA